MKNPAFKTLAARNTLLRDDHGRYFVGPARISIADNCISKVEHCSADNFKVRVQQWQQQDAELEIIDDGLLLSPAFVNAHTHLAMSFFRGIDLSPHNQHNMVEDLFFTLEQHLQPADVRAFTRMGAYESLLHGVGFVWDHYYHGESIAEALADTGLAGAVAPTLQDRSGPGKAAWQQQWQATEAINRNSSMRARGIYAAFGPHATDTVSTQLWQKIRAACDTLNLPLHAHLAQSLEEWQRCKTEHHCSPTEFLERIGVLARGSAQLYAHGIFATQSDIRLLAAAQHTLAFCPFSAMIFCFPANICNWEAAGVPWVVATDCAASNDSMNVQKELRFLSGFPLQELSYAQEYQRFYSRGESPESLGQQRAGIWQKSQSFRDPQWLLEKVWDLPGQLHPQVKLGRIEAGYLANLVLWNPSSPQLWPGNQLRSLAFGDSAGSIAQMMVAGNWLGEKGDFAGALLRSSEFREAEHEARRRLEELRARCGMVG
jgi:cytosine/adenosine deaminase-related metal-dependent hydrolase